MRRDDPVLRKTFGEPLSVKRLLSTTLEIMPKILDQTYKLQTTYTKS